MASLIEDGSIASVGRVGTLSLQYELSERRTVIAHVSCSSPWHYFPPSYLDDSGCAYTWLVNPSGGLVGGDHVTVKAQLHAGAHVVITSPSANRVYRTVSEPAVQEVYLSVGPGARLEWLPELTIPFAGSRFRQTIQVTLAPGATVLLWDAIASGRVSRGERWAFGALESEIRLVTASGRSLLERYALTPTLRLERAGLASDWDYVASLYLISDVVTAEVWKRLEDSLAAILDARPGLVLGGVSEPAAPGLAVKLLARSAPDLHAVSEALWAAVRAELWTLPPQTLRRY